MSTTKTREWHLASIHEAGHAAAHLDLGLPLYDARIWLRRHWWGGARGDGSVRLTRRGGARITATGAYILAALAGPEAEARAVHQLDGGALLTARRDAYDYSRDGDMTNVAGLMDQDTPFTLADAQAEASDLVDQMWRSVESIAVALRERGHLTANEIRRAA